MRWMGVLRPITTTETTTITGIGMGIETETETETNLLNLIPVSWAEDNESHREEKRCVP